MKFTGMFEDEPNCTKKGFLNKKFFVCYLVGCPMDLRRNYFVDYFFSSMFKKFKTTM